MAGPVNLILHGENETDRLGRAVANRLSPGNMVLLRGDLGAGKSALARALIRQLLDDPVRDVPSPSFALVQPYDGPSGPILHADLYRLGHAAEITELGLFDDDQAILVVEWPERAPELASRADLVIDLDIAQKGAARSAAITSPARSIDLKALAKAYAG